MKKRNLAAVHLRRELAEHPRLPAATRHVIAALAGETALPAWDLLGHDVQTVQRVRNRVRQAFEQALAETSRPTATHEAADLQTIIDTARDLQRAIKTSSLPGDWVRLDQLELSAEDMPTVPVDLGWHSLRPEGYEGGYPLAIYDVLALAAELAQQHLDSLPARALVRQKDQPEVTAFVRRLAWHFNREFEQEHRTAIGHITTAVFRLETPMDAKGVDVRLKPRKAPVAKT
jgi:hypothetical protein